MAEPRTWKSTDGNEIVAELLVFHEPSGKVKIRREDGKEFTFSKERLSEADHEFLAAHQKLMLEKKQQIRAIAGKTQSYTSTGSHKASYHVHYPSSYSVDKKMPLLILFEPFGNGKGILRHFQKSAEELGWVIVGCDQLKNKMNENLGSEIFIEMLHDIEKTIEFHDPERLYMGGYSGGAMRAYLNTVEFNRPWRGVISCAGWIGGRKYHHLEFQKNMAVAMVVGIDDKATKSHVKAETEVLLKHNAKVQEFPFPGGHVVGPSAVLTEALKWMDENTRLD